MKRHHWIIIGCIVVALAVIAGSWYGVARRNQVATTTPTPTVSPTGETASPSPSESATPIPSESPTISPLPTTVPSEVKAAISQFYTAYTGRDRTALGKLFTADTTDEDRSVHSTLFTGYDLRGNPGGPTLFITDAVSDTLKAYEMQTGTQSGDVWTVTVHEQRTTVEKKNTTPTVTLTMMRTAAGWRVNAYTRSGQGGKYDGFFTTTP